MGINNYHEIWSSCGHDCTGDAATSFLSSAVPKETKSSELSNSLCQVESDVVADAVLDSLPQTSPQSSVDSATTQTSVTEKAKKKKTKSKKRSEKIVTGASVTSDGISATESDSASLQLPLGTSEESGNGGKRSKRMRSEGQVVRSEDVDGYCGSLPVDDLIEFIDCGRKLWRSRSRPDAGSLTESEKLDAVKKESVKDAAVENDSGFGDTEAPDRMDGSHSDGALSPSVSSVAESVEIVAELLSDLLIPAADPSSAETSEEKSTSSVCELPVSVSEVTADSELSLAVAFLSDEEFARPEPEFVVVRQKKRRTKNKGPLPAKDANQTGSNLDGLIPSHNTSVINSSASSERSDSPQLVSTVIESTVSGHLNHQVSDNRGNTSRNGHTLPRRFNSQPRWRPGYSRFHSLPNSSNELRPMNTWKHASGSQSARRWLTSSGGKLDPVSASLQQKEVDKMKVRNQYLSASHRSQLPDVIPTAERPREASKSCLSSVAKVLMQDAHCQTVDDATSESMPPDTTVDSKQTCVPFDLLTLQLFMYHG